MNEDKAKKILQNAITEEDGLFDIGGYIAWHQGDEELVLDGEFTLEELEAICWWIKNKGK